MYIIDCINNNFTIDIKITDIEDKDNFQDSVDYLKYHFLYFSSDIKRWKIPINRIDEILTWFDRHNKEYKITDDALNHLEKVLNRKKEENFLMIKNLIFQF